MNPYLSPERPLDPPETPTATGLVELWVIPDPDIYAAVYGKPVSAESLTRRLASVLDDPEVKPGTDPGLYVVSGTLTDLEGVDHAQDIVTAALPGDLYQVEFLEVTFPEDDG